MPRVELRILGASDIRVEDRADRVEENAADQPLINFPTAKTQALLLYIAIEYRAIDSEPQRAHTHQRRTLAALLWPDIGDTYARKNLRNTLYYLRQTLDKAEDGLAEALLHVTRQQIDFHAGQVRSDLAEFEALLQAAKEHNHTNLHDCDGCLVRMERALSLYRGELLAGFSLPDAPAFEEWLLLRREHCHLQAVDAARRLSEAYEARNRLDQASSVAQRLVAWDPYQEQNHALLMRIYARQGDAQRALAHYQTLCQLLQTEFNAPPTPQTHELVQQIAAGAFAPPVEPVPARLPPTGPDPTASSATTSFHSAPPVDTTLDLSEIPEVGPFFGRVQERQQITRWVLHERCRTVAILGMGGQGKTSLAAECVREMANSEGEAPFDLVLWRSLVNAPPLTDLLSPLLQILSQQGLSAVPEQIDEQIRLFISYLRERRILLVLDNFESILVPEQAGGYRSGYEPYGQLIRQMATLAHESHLLLTSRERPGRYARLERDSPLVQSLQLTGLDASAGHDLLVQRGVAGVGEGVGGVGDEEARLLERYSGNPLALKVVADVIDELFDGDIHQFLAEEWVVFDDIRIVLEQQFERLTGLEQEILYWLAIEREPVSAPALRTNFLHQPAGQAFLEALGNLRRRSLIESARGRFALQNVITEFLTARLITGAVEELTMDELANGELSTLHRHGLLKADAKEYVRQSQARLLLQPVLTELTNRLGAMGVEGHLKRQLDRLREEGARRSGYAGGTILNLLVEMQTDLEGFDGSYLTLWQAHLQGVPLFNANLAHADLTRSTFTQSFGTVQAIAISPDGQLLASGAESGDITLWRLRDYQPVMTLTGHTNIITKLAFHPDGHQLASSSIDSTLRLWDLDSGQALHTIDRPQTLLFGLAFSPDGRFLASCGSGSAVDLWDCRSGRSVCRLAAPLDTHLSGNTREVAFHPLGTMVGSVNLDGYVLLWDIAHLYDVETEPDQIGAAISPRIIASGEGESLISIAFSPDGKWVAGGDQSGLIQLWDLQTGQPAHRLEGHQGSVRSIAFGPDSEMVASGSFDHTVRLWNIKREECDALFPHQGLVWSVKFGPDGQTLASSGEDSIIRLWEIKSAGQAELIKMIQGYRSFIPAAAFSPTEPILALGDTFGTIRLWEIQHPKPKLLRTWQTHNQIVALAVSPDGRYLASATGLYNPTVQLWDMHTARRVALLKGHTGRVRALLFSPDGTTLASADSAIRLWSIQEPTRCRLVHQLEGHQNLVYNLGFSPDGAQLVSSSGDHTIRLWDTSQGHELACIPGLGGNEALAHSPTTDTIACSAGTGGGIRLVDLSDPQAVETNSVLEGHAHEPVSLSFHPGGKRLVSGSSDHSVCLWDVEEGKSIYVLDKHEAYVRFVEFDPGGHYFVSSSIDGCAYLWEAETGRCLHTFRASRPYEGTNITGVTGISDAQRAALRMMGAVETS